MNLKERYTKEIVPIMMKELSYKSPLQVPRLKKIVINRSVGEATTDAKFLEKAAEELAIITGQKPLITRAKKSIATFKLRSKMPIGCKVTLRGSRMYDFFDKFVNIALPKIRDFKGISPNSFDGRGNYSLGIKEQLIFPELDYDRVDKIRGMDITIETSTLKDEEAKALLKFLGMPFRQGN